MHSTRLERGLCIVRMSTVYLFDMFQTFSDFVSILFIFGDINIPMFWLYMVLADCTITICLDSNPYGLLVVSDLHSPHLCETLYHFDSTSTLFAFVPRPYILHIDLNTPCSTSLLQLFIVLAHVSILLWSHSIFCYYICRPIQSFLGHILTLYHPISPLYAI